MIAPPFVSLSMWSPSAVVPHVLCPPLRRLWERDDEEVSCSGTCGRTTTSSTGRRHWCRTGPGGPAHTDDTYRGRFQPVQRTGNLGLLDHIDEETGRSNRHQPLTSNDVSSVVYGYKCWCFHTIFRFCPDEDWSIQSKHQQGFLISKLVSENSLFQISISYVQSLAYHVIHYLNSHGKGSRAALPHHGRQARANFTGKNHRIQKRMEQIVKDQPMMNSPPASW